MGYVIVDNRTIEYIRKYNARRNIKIQINENQDVIVSAPRWVPKYEVENFIKSKSNWIFKSIEKQKQLKETAKINTLENGKKIWFRGNEYTLKYEPSNQNFVFIMDNNVIVFTKRIDDLEYSQNVFLKWLKELAQIDFNEALQKYRNNMIMKYNIPEFDLQIRSMKTRWGTCTPAKKKITLNLGLMYTPKECLDYVALHELTHFLEIGHNQRFYSIMQEYMPDYKNIQKYLNKEFGQIIKE